MAVERSPSADAGPRKDKGDAPSARPPRKPFSWTWVGVAPFFLFAFLFLFLPSASIFVRSFEGPGGTFTLQNILDIFQKSDIRNAYKLSLQISATTALGGAFFGFLLAYARDHRRAPEGSAQLHADLLGRCVQLRRRAAGLRLRGDDGQCRPGHSPH